jgi:hypothetical protein
MIAEFGEAVEQLARTYQPAGMIHAFHRSQSPSDIDKASVYFDLDTERHLARITCWSTGDLQMEILSLDDGQTILDEYRKLTHHQEIEEVVVYFFEKLLYPA